MPKNKQGGKKHKKYAKNSDAFTRQLILADEEQYYALVTKHLGNGRVYVFYIDNEKVGIEILANIRGSFQRRRGANFVSVNNIVSYKSSKVKQFFFLASLILSFNVFFFIIYTYPIRPGTESKRYFHLF